MAEHGRAEEHRLSVNGSRGIQAASRRQRTLDARDIAVTGRAEQSFVFVVKPHAGQNDEPADQRGNRQHEKGQVQNPAGPVQAEQRQQKRHGRRPVMMVVSTNVLFPSPRILADAGTKPRCRER